jgi:hypothetical protein
MGTQVTSPIDSELKQLVVALATQFYYAVRDTQPGHDPNAPRLAGEGLGALLPAITAPSPGEWSGNLPQTAEEFEVAVQKAKEQTGIRAYGALGYMISVFNDLTRYAEAACPDVDIPEFLRQAGLRAASDE